ncbi:MAG: ferredoxin [Spirochaetia bacterium]|nr:ferredoxin [Spirochaetia bacterium]
MADKSDKNENNVEGKFYVDNTCTSCGLCTDTAPEFFDTDDDDLAYVKKQPTDQEGEELCQEALDSCPVEAIGDDG